MGFVYLDVCIVKLDEIERVYKHDSTTSIIQVKGDLKYASKMSLSEISIKMNEASNNE